MQNSLLKMRTLALLLPAVLLLAVAVPSSAFRLIGAMGEDGTYCAGALLNCDSEDTFVRFFEYNVPFWVNVDAEADASDAGLTQADIESAAQAAYQSWEDVDGAIIRFSYQGATSQRLSGLDGANTTVFYNAASDAGDCVDGVVGSASGTLAITIITEIVSSGEITDVDVLMDSADTWLWNDDCSEFELQTVLTHEYGHSIGIHHSDEYSADQDLRPTMYAYYFCNAGTAAGRSLEPDDEEAAVCLYPEYPTTLLIDQTGSMCVSSRMDDAKASAHAFVDAFADNLISVAAFGEGTASSCSSCVSRPGYELLQDWTTDTALLHTAVESTYPCGMTPLWESACCAITKAQEQAPANLVVYTDTGENSSDGTCGCTTYADVATAAAAADVVVYVIDMTNYYGPDANPGLPVTEDVAPFRATDSENLEDLAARTGGLYFDASSSQNLYEARAAIQTHIGRTGKIRRNPPDCYPGGNNIDAIQEYTGAPGRCFANSPWSGTEAMVQGTVTVRNGSLGPGVIYVENCTGGIRVEGSQLPMLDIGDSVQVSGVVVEPFGEIMLSQIYQVQKFGPTAPIQAPIVEPGTAKLCEHIGLHIGVRGYAGADGAPGDFPLVQEMALHPSTGIKVVIDPHTGIDPTSIRKGNYYTIFGVVSVMGGTPVLLPRGGGDLSGATGAGEAGVSGLSGLLGNSPNPFDGSTVIRFAVLAGSPARLSVYDVAGRLVSTLVDDEESVGGVRTVVWRGTGADGTPASAGVYFYRLDTPQGADTRRMVLMK
ncbi:MAG: matrixin family metalloprotease [Gemmatimonadota bacterium]|nr:matrixin family metalloprotease [Gemmatimonadota bacterium]